MVQQKLLETDSLTETLSTGGQSNVYMHSDFAYLDIKIKYRW
jgi:hypothetical protein